MFGRRYFGGRFFGPRYFGGVGAATVAGSYFGAGFFGPRYFGQRYWSPQPSGGSGGTEWDIAAPLDLPALAGTLTLAGDLTFAGASAAVQSGGGGIVGGKKKRRVGLNYERLRIEDEDAMVMDVITALIAAEVI